MQVKFSSFVGGPVLYNNNQFFMTATASKLAPKQLRDSALGDRTSLAPTNISS
ncbi:hypothetical protein QUB10_29080 [Microcoleus sp. B5-D4]|uniref:hypothetical protein n=1 Tax=unclassified Microcoleus TaxID=2642155 RepID=UPI002FD11943